MSDAAPRSDPLDELFSGAPRPAGPPDETTQATSDAAAGPTEAVGRVSGAFDALRRELESLGSLTNEYESRSVELDRRERQMQQHASQLSEREHELCERFRELSEAQRTLQSEASSWKQREEELGDRERAVAAAAERLGELHAWCTLRRSRLVRERGLLADHALKLRDAAAALAARAAERPAPGRIAAGPAAALADSAVGASAPVPERSAVAAPSAPSRTRRGPRMIAIAAAFMFSAGGVGAIGAASWWIAGVLQPPTYLAHCTLAMERQPGTAAHTDEAVESWRAFHVGLAEDPMLMEQVAQRLKRRGYETLATPADVRARTEQDLTVEEASPGELRLTFKGQGAAQTRHVLETFASALAASANDARSRRLDRATTVVTAPARVEDTPVRDTRLGLFAGISAGMVGVCAALAAAGVTLVGRMGAASGNKAAVPEDGGEERWKI
ncbi:MAG: hypothetical protein SFZ24_05735 [Planctomycetota bacterium]|nr:hypothetical protein [Planctomycetota bacterium]